MIVKCIEEHKELTVGKEYPVINEFGISNGFKLQILNDEGFQEDYPRYLFEKVEI